MAVGLVLVVRLAPGPSPELRGGGGGPLCLGAAEQGGNRVRGGATWPIWVDVGRSKRLCVCVLFVCVCLLGCLVLGLNDITRTTASVGDSYLTDTQIVWYLCETEGLPTSRSLPGGLKQSS